MKPERLTDTLLIQPVHSPDPDPGVRVLRYYPELAFGTGGHATTRLAARAVEAEVQAKPGAALLDVGTGNGVLAMVGLLAGASEAVGLDIDENAVRAATANAELNGLEDRARFLTLPLGELDATFPLVVANIDAPTLLALAGALARCTVDGVSTNVPLHQEVLAEADFAEGGVDTA